MIGSFGANSNQLEYLTSIELPRSKPYYHYRIHQPQQVNDGDSHVIDVSKDVRQLLRVKKEDQARCLFLLGQVYEQLENKERAAVAYKDALHTDYTLMEAFDMLVKHRLISLDSSTLIDEISSKF